MGLVLISHIVQANNQLAGKWSGQLKVQGMELLIVFNVTQDEQGQYQATMDSPDQGASGIPVSSVSFEHNQARFEVKMAQGFYQGKLTEDGQTLEGEWSQGQAFPLTLKKNQTLKQLKRPQEPTAPYPYLEEEVRYQNPSAGIELAGTLTLPKGKGTFPAVILISGSGPQDRNQAIMGHKPFWVLADYLTRHGIAVLRYDDRGVAQSGGNFSQATSLDFASDVVAGIEYLKSREDINAKKIGLIGHSEGGLIAPIVAAQHTDVAYSVLLAGPGITGHEISMKQVSMILRANKVSEKAIKAAMSINKTMIGLLDDDHLSEQLIQKTYQEQWNSLEKDVQDELDTIGAGEFNQQQVQQLLSPWYRYFSQHDPYPWLLQVKSPVLAINGDKDVQVIAEDNLPAIEKALKEGGNRDYQIKTFSGLNHLFQNANTGLINEYSKIEETIAPEVLEFVTEWVLKQAK